MGLLNLQGKVTDGGEVVNKMTDTLSFAAFGLNKIQAFLKRRGDRGGGNHAIEYQQVVLESESVFQSPHGSPVIWYAEKADSGAPRTCALLPTAQQLQQPP